MDLWVEKRKKKKTPPVPIRCTFLDYLVFYFNLFIIYLFNRHDLGSILGGVLQKICHAMPCYSISEVSFDGRKGNELV